MTRKYPGPIFSSCTYIISSVWKWALYTDHLVLWAFIYRMPTINLKLFALNKIVFYGFFFYLTLHIAWYIYTVSRYNPGQQRASIANKNKCHNVLLLTFIFLTLQLQIKIVESLSKERWLLYAIGKHRRPWCSWHNHHEAIRPTG